MLSSSSSTTFFVGTLRRSTFLFSGSDDVAVTAVSCRFLPGDEELGVIPTRLRVSLANPLVWAYQTDWKKKVFSQTQTENRSLHDKSLSGFLFDFFSSSVFFI